MGRPIAVGHRQRDDGIRAQCLSGAGALSCARPEGRACLGLHGPQSWIHNPLRVWWAPRRCLGRPPRSQADHDRCEHCQWAGDPPDFHPYALRKSPTLDAGDDRRAGRSGRRLPLRGVRRVVRDAGSGPASAQGKWHMQTTWSLSGIISPALAAFIIAAPALLPRDIGALAPVVAVGNGTPLVIAIDALTFFVCAAVLLLV